MLLTRHQTSAGARWALDSRFLPTTFTLPLLLTIPHSQLSDFLESLPRDQDATGPVLPPIEVMQEVWACGVTYMRSREAREMESASADIYSKVYDAVRPELFFKATGWRVVGDGEPVRIRHDSLWNVPEPELTLVINAYMEIVGYCCGNDVSSRDIEGQNPLYLPQAKIFNGSCALGPSLELIPKASLESLPIELKILRDGNSVFEGDSNTAKMKRSLPELVAFLGCELEFPQGVFLMTGTGIVPPDHFSLQVGDVVNIRVGGLSLTNPVAI